MIKHISVLSALLLVPSMWMPAASALSATEAKQCNALGASLKVRHAEAKTMTAERDAWVEEVEAAGDEWDAAEALRKFGKSQAAQADAKQGVYDGLKRDLMRKEMALQSAVSMLNGDVYDYNQLCSKR